MENDVIIDSGPWPDVDLDEIARINQEQEVAERQELEDYYIQLESGEYDNDDDLNQCL
mgnify:CR=1 FL=1